MELLFRLLTFQTFTKINQLQMYISQLLPKSHGTKNTLLTSIIEPDSRNIDRNVEFITKKIALADKTLIRQYKERANKYHPNIPQLTITQNSEFYVTVNLEKCRQFEARDLIIIPFNKRAKLLADILRGIAFLSQNYGYFYLTAKMLSYTADGQINVWMNEDYFCNRPQYPINHGRLSEQIFIADFKQTFGGNFQQMRQFRRAKNFSSLMKILDRGQDIYHSLLMSEPITKESLIYRDETLKFSNVLNSHTTQQFGEEKRMCKELNHAESMKSIIINVNSENYGQYKEKERKLTRTLSSPGSIKMTPNISPKFQNNQRNTYGSLTSQYLPRINFTYATKDAWKKKANEPQSQASHFKSLRIRQTENQSTSIRQSSKEFLKVSFPYTTTHSFSPLASFGSINLNSAQQDIIQDPERPNENKKMEQKLEIGMEQIGQMQLQFQNLFQSNVLQGEQELQNLEVIMQEFENILEG